MLAGMLAGCVSTRHIGGQATILSEILAEEFEGRRVMLRAVGEPSVTVDVLAIADGSMQYRVVTRESPVASIGLRDVCRLTPRPGGTTADRGAALMAVGFGGVVVAGGRRDVVDGVGVGVASALITIAGLLLTGRRDPETRAYGYQFHNPACDGSP